MPVWLLVLLQDFVVPELKDYIEKYFAEKGKLPTLEELNASILTDTNTGIAKGVAWLASKGIGV